MEKRIIKKIEKQLQAIQSVDELRLTNFQLYDIVLYEIPCKVEEYTQHIHDLKQFLK